MVRCGGTSPRMRGKPPRSLSPMRQAPEHPRVCGENLVPVISSTSTYGTSPRMRGKHLPRTPQINLRRNIPAYAGKTFHHARSRVGGTEHPRVCGENHTTNPPSDINSGTSPRMRGKPGWAFCRSSRPREHPRVCGENCASRAALSRVWGTSPRMRGKRSACGYRYRPGGNIPAYAGKTSGVLRLKNSISGTSPRMRGKPR